MLVMLSNSDDRYGLISKILHWSMALGIIGLIWLGWWIVDLSYYDSWYNRGLKLHRAFGMVVLILATLFMTWKIVTPSPPFQSQLRPWERLGAHVAHGVLMLAMFSIPISGYLTSTSAGEGFSFFELFQVPAVLPKSEPLRDLAIAVHYYFSYGMIAVIATHAGAAFKHQFLDKHGTLRRML